MNQTLLSLTVFFGDPLWIGSSEHREQQLLYLRRIIFGSEPSEQVVCERLKGCWCPISSQAPAETVRPEANHRNPKRMQRGARKAQDTELSPTESQLAVKQQQEERAQRKAERRKVNRGGQKGALRLRQMKKKAKHKGRRPFTPPTNKRYARVYPFIRYIQCFNEILLPHHSNTREEIVILKEHEYKQKQTQSQATHKICGK